MSSVSTTLRVGAMAITSGRANAVGSVWLSCGAERLGVDLLQVSRYVPGFAFVGSVRAVSYRVPYAAVRGLVREGAVLNLALDPKVVTPYNRFALCRFSREPHAALMRTFRLRTGVRLLSLLLPLPLAALMGWLVPRELVGGPVGVTALALVVAWASWQLLRQITGWLTWGGPGSDRLREAFEHRLSQRLGLEPVETRGDEPAPAVPRASDVPRPAVIRPSLRGAWGVALRPRAFGLVAAVALASALAAVAAVKQYGVIERFVLPVTELRRGLAGPVRERFDAGRVAGSPRHPLCRCQRSDSVLWGDGAPQLSILISPRRGRVGQLWVRAGETVQVLGWDGDTGAQPDTGRAALEAAAEQAAEGEGKRAGRKRRKSRRRGRGGAQQVEFDLAVVNNGALTLDTVSLIVTFAQRTASGRRTAIVERGLFWPAELGPGRAVKWEVAAEGTEFRVDCELQARLGDVPAASAETFHELLDARLTAVRVHAAMMLGYLGDPRAREAALSLGRLSALEEQARGEVLRTQRPLRICGRRPKDGGLELCVHNSTDQLVRSVELAELAPEAPSTRSWGIDDYFLPGHGLRVHLPLEGKQPPPTLLASSPSPAE